MKKGIFTKYLFSFIILIILSLSISLFVSVNTIKKSYFEQKKEQLSKLAKSIGLFIEQDSLTYDKLNDKILKLSQNIDSRITIILKNGKVIIDTKKNPKLMENHKNRPEIIDAQKKGEGFRIRFSNTLKRKMIYLAIPLYNKNKEIIGFLRLSSFANNIYKLIDNIKKKIFFTAFLIIILSIFISFILANHLTKPIKDLVKASNEVAKGNYKVRVFTKNHDELYELATNFNFMTEKIALQISEISKQSEELSSIINSINEIFWVINKNDEIVFRNKAFNEFIKKDYSKNKKYWEVFANNKLIDKINNILKFTKNEKVEMKIDNNFYILSSLYLPKSFSTIFLLYDITKIKNLQEVKKDFVVNASHELKTPLTSIKGFLETMEENATPENSYYLKILHRNTDRLINIVNDIITLSKIESGGEISLERMDIRKVLQNSINIFEQKAEEKQIKIMKNFLEIPKINIDPFKLEQVFVNLIDNAIKYSNEKSIIKISVFSKDNFVRIDFSDNGIGIKKEIIPRLFERFYVADKSRTRKVGGTGLGLSIVKHIVHLHNGKIDIQSEFGKGTKIRLWLPITI